MDTVRLSFFVGPGGRPLQEADVHVTISPSHNRTPLPAVDAACIAGTWATKVAELGPRLFNGSKFRLGGLAASPSAATGDLALHFWLGLTDYRDSLGTTSCIDAYRRAHASGAAAKACPDDGSTPGCEAHLAMALGIECLLVTKDQQCVLFRRSKHVAQHAGWLCCPGGHPEPKHLCPTVFEGHEAAALHFARDVGAAAVVHELFDSAICEVVDEIGLDRPTLTNSGLIAVVHSQLDLKPDLIFLVSTALTAREVAAVHNQRLCAEAYESDEGSLLFVPLDGVAGATDNVTPPSVACLLLGAQVVLGTQAAVK